MLCYVCGALGITAGAHRLWSHRAYKARLPLRILLVVFNTIASQVRLLVCVHVYMYPTRTSFKQKPAYFNTHNGKY